MNLLYNYIKLYLICLLFLEIKANKKEVEENIIKKSYYKEYISLLNWAKNNSLNMTNKINLTEIDDEKQYLAINEISKGEILLDIPPNITIDINTFYNFFPSKNLEKKYEKYVKIGKKSNKILNDLSYINQSFMAFLLYKIKLGFNNNKTNSDLELNNFYNYYKYLYLMFQDDLSHLPSSFTDKQINKFMNTTFNYFFNLMNGYLTGETEILKDEIFLEEINLDEYFKYRFLLVQKTLNITNKTTLVPFIDLIKRDFNNENINCKIIVNKGHIRIKSIKEIKKGELLILKQKRMTNQYSYFFYGKTYEELINYVPSFIIPIIIPDLLINEGIELDIQEDNEENQVDLVWDKYYDIVLPTYQEVLKLIKRENSKINCYNLFMKYLTIIRDTISMNNIDDLDEIFDDERDIDNIKMIIKGEIDFLNKKIEEMKNVIENNKKDNRNIIKDRNKHYDDL